jgi:hypothetical protein
MTFKFAKVTIAAVLAIDTNHGVASYEAKQKQYIDGDEDNVIESLRGGRSQKKRQVVVETKTVGAPHPDYKGFDAGTTTPELFDETDTGILGTNVGKTRGLKKGGGNSGGGGGGGVGGGGSGVGGGGGATTTTTTTTTTSTTAAGGCIPSGYSGCHLYWDDHHCCEGSKLIFFL